MVVVVKKFFGISGGWAFLGSQYLIACFEPLDDSPVGLDLVAGEGVKRYGAS
jgi:hypothetical protein